MPIIAIAFNYPQASPPKYTIGDRVAITDNCPPKDWLVGKVIGLSLEENDEIRWWYSVRLNSPTGFTEEYQDQDIVPETTISMLQAQWQQGEAIWDCQSSNSASDLPPLPKFTSGMRLKFRAETGCNLLGDFGKVIGSRYEQTGNWSGWVYQLANEYLSQPIEIGETWLELATKEE